MRVLVAMLRPERGDPSIYGVYSDFAVMLADLQGDRWWYRSREPGSGRAVFRRRAPGDPYDQERLVVSGHEVLSATSPIGIDEVGT